MKVRTLSLAMVLVSAPCAWSQTPYMVKDINPGPASGLDWPFEYHRAFVFDGVRLFFSATRPDIGNEIWTSLGTEATTTPVDYTPGPGSTSGPPIGMVGGTVDTANGFSFDTPMGYRPR